MAVEQSAQTRKGERVMSKEFHEPQVAPRETVRVDCDRCELCAYWLRVRDWHTGKCGKRNWRTDENDYCAMFKLKGLSSV